MWALMAKAALAAKKNGGKRLEACPMAHDQKRSTAGLFVGPKRVFDRAGFETVMERKAGRPLMRLQLAKRSTVKPALKSTSKLAPKSSPGAKR